MIACHPGVPLNDKQEKCGVQEFFMGAGCAFFKTDIGHAIFQD
jgi:hypothetical protein